MAAATVFAQIKYTNINPDSVLNISVSGTFSEDSAVYLDLDGDTKDDFYFKYQYISGFAGVTWKLQMHCTNADNQAYWKSTSTAGGNHFMKGLKFGDSITKNSLFGVDLDPLLGDHKDGNVIGKGDTYIGIRFVSGGKIYYGWILLNASYAGGTKGDITVKAYAYNSTPDEKINAGDTCVTTTSTTYISNCDSVVWNGFTYKTSGTYAYKTTNSVGCDSIAFVEYTNNTTTNKMLTAACDSFKLNNSVYYTSGVYKQVLANANAFGCDSIIELNLTVRNATDTALTLTACDSIKINNIAYHTTGNYTQTLTNAAGCDSTIHIDLTVNYSKTSTIFITACDTFELDGVKYTATGNYLQTVKSALGCDSIISLHLTINNSTVNNMTQTACDSFVLNGVTYTTSGNYTQTLTNAAGCDSTINLSLTINKSTLATMMVTACDSFKLNDSVYYQTGTYTQVMPNSMGCDSTIMLHLTVNPSSTNTININSCGPYTLNGTTYTTSGTYTQTLVNDLFCDSVLIIVLNVQTVNISVAQNNTALTAAATGVDYQWLNCSNNYSIISGEDNQSFTPTANGDYAVEITDGSCVDTSVCFAVLNVGVNNNFPTGISVYPNPTTGDVSLNLGETYTNVTIGISNILGEVISQRNYTTAKDIQLTVDAAPGIYFITINTPQYNTRVKVIKQ